MTATWVDVARKDVEDAARSKMLWGFIAVFAAFVTMALPVADQLFPAAATVTPAKALSGVAMLAQLFVPGIALVAGYMAVVGERRSGSLRVLLGAPFSRRDVVAGKLAGRLLVTVLSLTVGFAVASVLVVTLYGVPDGWAFAGFVGAGVLLGATFTGLAVGGSALASSRGTAMTVTIGPFMAMVFFWKPVVAGLYYAVTGSLPGLHAEQWYFVLKRLNPLEAFRVLASTALDERVTAVPRFPVEDVPRRAPLEQVELANRLAGPVPFYLDPWFSAVVLLAWGAVPVLLGVRHFDRSDLG
ncbi:MAG: ABC transporter permease subunit [Halobacteriaceae archaeon]